MVTILPSVVKKEIDVVIRNATLSDLPSIIMINREALPENYPEWFFREHLERWGKAFYVAEVDGRVIGYIMSRIEEGTALLRNIFALIRKGHVVSVAVLKEYRRLGIGTMLMLRAMEAMKDIYNCSEVYLEVRVSNIPAINLYQKLGFKIVRRIPRYYMDGEDAYLMAKEL